MDLFTDIGPVEAARRVREQIGDVATIVSVDMDVLEPGECPGVGFLETGENKEEGTTFGHFLPSFANMIHPLLQVELQAESSSGFSEL